ncbi:hypothetical protein [Methylomicrobium agile]|uniref:hypothetical protein n=1 Tax=Methylomicrobium agile TaxID=39774 RepID=UPI0004DF43C0|nr:hypothetical protein [Methylomicrobium agile]
MASQVLKNLKIYEVYIQYWDPDANDTFLLVGLRGWLHDHADELNVAQAKRLRATDEQVLQLVAQNHEETEDTVDLRLIAEIIKLRR